MLRRLDRIFLVVVLLLGDHLNLFKPQIKKVYCFVILIGGVFLNQRKGFEWGDFLMLK